MFEQSILVQKRTTKPWSVLLSLAAELAGIGLLIVTPLVWAQKMPTLSLTRIAVWMPLRPAAPQVPDHTTRAGSRTKPSPFRPSNPLIWPVTTTNPIATINDVPPEIPGSDAFARVPGNTIGISAVENTPGPPVQQVRHTVDKTPTGPIIRVRVSKMEPAKIVYKVMPIYPILARTTHTSGTVYLIGVIATDGRIQSLHVLRGHPLLVAAALEAVRQWRYQPTILNGQAVEVEAPIDVTFTLQ